MLFIKHVLLGKLQCLTHAVFYIGQPLRKVWRVWGSHRRSTLTELHCHVLHNWNYNWLLYYITKYSICLIIPGENMNETQSVDHSVMMQGWTTKAQGKQTQRSTSNCTSNKLVSVYFKWILFIKLVFRASCNV